MNWLSDFIKRSLAWTDEIHWSEVGSQVVVMEKCLHVSEITASVDRELQRGEALMESIRSCHIDEGHIQGAGWP